MPYTRPPIAKFRALYPQFTTPTDQQYDAWADKIERKVGEGYGDEQQDATELLIAHTLAVNGVGTGAMGKMALNGATSFDSGDFALDLSNDFVNARTKGGYGATIYGRQFQEIQRRLFGGPRLVGCI